MISFACETSVTPGSWMMIWSCEPCELWRATTGSATPSSLTRRSMVRIAWSTVSVRSWLAMFGLILNVYVPLTPESRS